MPDLTAETLVIEGPDALAFAHAQLSSDVHQLAIGTWQWSAWLNPQGRVQALLQLIRLDEQRLRLLLRGGTALALAPALRPYILRSKVNFFALTTEFLVDAPPCPLGSVIVDGADTILGMSNYAIRLTPNQAIQTQHWRSMAIRAAHPWLPDTALDQLLAPALSLCELGAVSLDKGCFPGQEIVARLHYRGGCKQHLCRIQSTIPLTPGDTLSMHGEKVGSVLDSADEMDSDSLALVVMHDAVPSGRLLVGLDQPPYQTIVTRP